MEDLNVPEDSMHGQSKPIIVEVPKSKWLCVGCNRKLQPIFLEKHGTGPDSVVVVRCSKCLRELQRITETHVQCLFSKRLKPEQGEIAELSVRYGLVLEKPVTTKDADDRYDA